MTVVGEVTGEAPEPSEVIARGWRLRAGLQEVEPVLLDDVRAHLPTSRIRFGCVELTAGDAVAIRALARPATARAPLPVAGAGELDGVGAGRTYPLRPRARRTPA